MRESTARAPYGHDGGSSLLVTGIRYQISTLEHVISLLSLSHFDVYSTPH